METDNAAEEEEETSQKKDDGFKDALDSVLQASPDVYLHFWTLFAKQPCPVPPELVAANPERMKECTDAGAWSSYTESSKQDEYIAKALELCAILRTAVESRQKQRVNHSEQLD